MGVVDDKITTRTVLSWHVSLKILLRYDVLSNSVTSKSSQNNIMYDITIVS